MSGLNMQAELVSYQARVIAGGLEQFVGNGVRDQEYMLRMARALHNLAHEVTVLQRAMYAASRDVEDGNGTGDS